MGRSLTQQIAYFLYLYLYGISDRPTPGLPEQQLSNETNEWNKEAISRFQLQLQDLSAAGQSRWPVRVSDSNNEWNKQALQSAHEERERANLSKVAST
jgi:hypothetical protein